MLAFLERIDPNSDDLRLLVQLFATLRPKRAGDSARAIGNVRTLCQLLKGNPEQATALHGYIVRVLRSLRHTSLYSDIGVLSNDGFFTELKRRISYRMLPPALGDEYLSDALDKVIFVQTDYLWIRAVPAADWLELFDVISAAASPLPLSNGNERHIMLPGMLEAIRTLSYRVCAIGLEPKLTNVHTDIETFDSPFVMQNVEVNLYLDGYSRLLAGDTSASDDAKHLLVMLDQCDSVVAKIRRNAGRQGTSIALTYLLVALTQSIDRLRKLLFLVDVTGQVPMAPTVELGTVVNFDKAATVARPPSPQRAAAVALTMELVKAHNNKYAVRDLFADNIDLLARNVTENASRTGDHYIAESRGAMGRMFGAAAGAGFVIGFMAMIKILMSYVKAPPLVTAFMYSANYSLGFMFIHLLHFTVATKQPAMTASRIAAGLSIRDGRHIDLDSMAELVNKVFRTQIVAVLGNLALAIPTAYGVACGYAWLTGHNLATATKAGHLLQEMDPIHGPALLYAGVAGVCLFLSGLISGYYDNQALYTRMGQRIAQLRGLGRLIGQKRLVRFGLYLENNLGGLMGNFYFGILLGSIGTLGGLIGLPIDIRHVTFSAANFAIAFQGLGSHLPWQLALNAVLGFLGIGAVNLLVSFGLALWVALRARQVRFKHGFRLMRALGRRFVAAPIDFFIGAKSEPAPPDSLPARSGK